MNHRHISIYKFILLPMVLILCIFSVSCQPKPRAESFNAFYFDTVITLTFYNKQDAALAPACFALCEKYEKMLSRTIPESDISRINNAGGEYVEVDPETAFLLQEALQYCENTEGALDLTIAPVMNLWDFTSVSPDKQPPATDDLLEALSHVDYKNLTIDGNRVQLSDPRAEIDLGFIAKGYVADRLKEYLKEQGVSSAIINLGGNVLTIGSKPDGSAYQIGVKNPFDEQTPATVLSLADKSAVTSGTYERFFVHDEKTYHHILNTQNGMPVETDLSGVTIISSSSLQADALSTTCLILGKEKSKKLLKQYPDIEAVFLLQDGSVEHY